jgi:hypothetical protein
MAYTNCKEIPQSQCELCVVECNTCGFHLGVDATYLEQVDQIVIPCLRCGKIHGIEAADRTPSTNPILNREHTEGPDGVH